MNIDMLKNIKSSSPMTFLLLIISICTLLAPRAEAWKLPLFEIDIFGSSQNDGMYML